MFHSLGAEQENDSSYISVRDFGTCNNPLSVDRKFRVCTCDTGFSKVDMFSGVRSFNALYVNTALYRSIKKLFHYAIFQKFFFHIFFKYINGLSFTIHVINLSCNFVPINHINV